MNLTMLTNLRYEQTPWLREVLVLVFAGILTVGLLGNTLVILSVTRNPIQIRRSTANLLLVNMSFADLLILMFNAFDIIQFAFDPKWPTAWLLGPSLCKIVRFMQVLGCYVSVQTLLVISIERYFAIVYPEKTSRISRRKRLPLIFMLIWSIGLLAALPNLYLLKLHPFFNRPRYYICGLSDHWTDSHWITCYKYVESVLFFFLPAVIQTIVYTIICRQIFQVDRAVQAHSHARELQKSTITGSAHHYSDTKPSSSFPSPMNINVSTMMLPRASPHELSPTNSLGNNARKKAVIMLVIITLLYFVSFSPAQVNFVYTQINQSHHLYEYRLFFIVAILLALSSTAFNPVLFYIFNRFFRYKFNRLLRCGCPRCRRILKQQTNAPMV